MSGALLRDLLDTLVDGVQQAVRLRVEGRSTAQGRQPGWLEQAATFDVIDIREGSTELVVEAAPLLEAAPERFRQTELFTEVRVEDSCVDVFLESLEDAVTERADSDRFDDSLVGTFEQFGRVLRHQVERIEIVNARPLQIERESIERFRRLRRAFPADQRVMVAGRIDLLRHSDRVFTLILESGEVLRGVVTSEAVDLAELGRLWGQPAVVSGVAKFRPSGAVLRIEAEHVRPAEPVDTAVWSQAPRPLLADLDLRTVHWAQGPRSGVSAIFGQWPGDESEEEFLRTLDAI